MRLLLILDYVFDWARDVYRPEILHELKRLADSGVRDEISEGRDSDIFSAWTPVSVLLHTNFLLRDEIPVFRAKI